MKYMTILIHGFNVWDGGIQTVGKLAPFFSDVGSHYVVMNYGHFGLLETRFKNDKIAKRLAEAARNAKLAGFKIVTVGHSNGCAIIHRAAERYGAQIDKAVYINPALKKDIYIPDSIDSVDVWHSPGDRPVRWAKWLPASNARPWGEMGAVGYTGKSGKVRNFNKEKSFSVSSSSHSDVFKAEKLAFFGPSIARKSIA